MVRIELNAFTLYFRNKTDTGDKINENICNLNFDDQRGALAFVSGVENSNKF